MKSKILLIFLLCFFFSCKKEKSVSISNDWKPVTNKMGIRGGENFLELASGKHIFKISQQKLPFKRVIFLNSSLLGYPLHLNLEEKIVGIASPEYIFSEKIHRMMKDGRIQNVGNEQKYDVEKIISLKPDAIFTNYIPNFESVYDIIKQNGIELIFLDEYLESTPLEKTAYLKVFGVLMGEEKASEIAFEKIKQDYSQWKKIAEAQSGTPEVLVNEMYGNQWYMAGGKTFVANYLNDAGANYILKNNQEEISVPMTFEEVYEKAKNAKIWVNIGSQTTKKGLLASNPNYSKMSVFQNGKLYNTLGRERGRANDLYESGAVRSDLVLRDYVKIFYPNLVKDTLVYMKELH